VRLRTISGKFSLPAASASGWRTADLIGAVAFVAILLTLAWRLTQGADFSDESYYAIFIDDWLKGGIRSSALLTLHQTAALIVYPAARVYTAVIGSDNGLMLFLRSLYLLGSALAAGCWFAFLRHAGSHGSAWAAAVAALAFIPGGLPAPSYDTLGLQGLSVGLAAFGAAQFAETVHARWIWRIVSALGWAVATVAYPSLGVVLGIFLFAVLVALPVIQTKAWLASVILLQIAAWAGVVIALGFGKLHDSVSYTAAYEADFFLRKLQLSAQVFASHKVFAWACLLATTIGICRNLIGATCTSVAIAFLLLLTISISPALFVRSSDLIFVLALSGLGLLAGFRPGASPQRRLFAVLYVTTMSAGIITTLSAFYGLYSFCVGGAPAAILALAEPDGRRPVARLAITTRTSLAAAALLVSSLTYFYGDLPDVTSPRQRIGWGVFAGLALQQDQAAILRLMRDQVGPLIAGARTIAEVGLYPALILATPARPLMPSVVPLVEDNRTVGLRLNAPYFASHSADVVLIYIDPHFDVANPYGPGFPDRYTMVGRFTVASGILEVFRLKGS
jgi:hypothetical protein